MFNGRDVDHVPWWLPSRGLRDLHRDSLGTGRARHGIPGDPAGKRGGERQYNLTPNSSYHVASITDNGTEKPISNPYVIDDVS